MKPASEDDILALVNRFFPVDHPSLLLGRGDDCAVLRPGAPLAVSTDIFAEDAHFRRRYFTPYDTGFKALAVNISDIGASGASPSGISIGLTLTGKEDEEWLSGFCRGMKDLCDRFSLALSGGDLARSSLLNVCVTAWGELPEGLPMGLRRGMAKEGDIVFLVGSVGLARLGLTLLEQGSNPEECEDLKAMWPEACSAHLRPMPLAKEGMALARFALRHHLEERLSLMDVSDGLARDLPRLLARGKTGLGADIVLSPEDLAPEILRYASQHGITAPDFAFEGGEDYALVGTCPSPLWPELAHVLSGFAVPSLLLGTVGTGPIALNGHLPVSAGFDHFSG
ncbi:thiamine-phosphate kinase [Mailhella massiliensis]|uniref:Thiamine-monophosphate kinase n=1 Tax=Mailhella massiliensis TaxID=1903261 RepID=A0A921DQE3_9BACT|nr:thiamine-phosphate kinase [Mailhella massiliensis]HJD96379.1 thiamine-phosphate kinase [Mailhella massiliensis]